MNAQLYAQKYRIRQRIDEYHYGRRPFQFTLGNAFGIAAGFLLLMLCGMAAFR